MSNVPEKGFVEVVELIQSARSQVFRAINTALVDLYWKVGGQVSKRISAGEWGNNTVERLAEHIAEQYPDIKGFTRASLFRMRQFYETYQADEKVAPLVRQLPWSHNLVIMGRCKQPEEREFYLHLAQENRWSRRMLERKISECLFERTVLSPPQVSSALVKVHVSSTEIFRDSYVLDFLNLPEVHSEKDLQRGLIKDLRKFLQTLGPDFCFIGEEFQMQVGGKDFYLDLLFYQRALECLVAFELKIDDFKPEYLGKLEFYLEVLDRDVRKPKEKPSVGILLCKSKDSEVVEYALSRTLSPSVVAQYETVLPDKKLLQAKLQEFYELEAFKGQRKDECRNEN